MERHLLFPDEPVAFEFLAGSPASPYFITCDHASQRLPRVLGTLGLSQADLERHIAWDIGAAGLSRKLAVALQATLVLQPYSRLAIDCNRPLIHEGSIAARSEGTVIPGNQAISSEDAELRAREIFNPYHERIGLELDERKARNAPTVLLLVHSFTPVYHGVSRPWHAGVLYQRDRRLGQALLSALRTEPGLVIGDNEPYWVSDDSDYGAIVYGEGRQLPHVELEIRQDLISDDAGQTIWAERLARHLQAIVPELLQAQALAGSAAAQRPD